MRLYKARATNAKDHACFGFVCSKGKAFTSCNYLASATEQQDCAFTQLTLLSVDQHDIHQVTGCNKTVKNAPLEPYQPV